MVSELIDKTGFADLGRFSKYCTLMAIGFGAIVITLEAYSSYQTLNYPGYTAGSEQQKPQAITYKATDITRQNLFGRAEAAVVDPSQLPETRLQLILRGAFTSDDPQRASAIIEGPDQQSRSYRINSRVYGGAQLHAVYKDKVVLSRAGQLENLYFPSAETGIQTETPPVTSDNNIGRKTSISTTISSKATPGLSEQQRQDLIRARLQELRDRSRNKG